MHICQEYETSINDTHAKYFLVMDQTSLVWRKKIKALEKAKPQAPEYTLRSITKYLNALYENQELEFKISNSKLKEAEAKTQTLRKELLMLNLQLSTMKEEKERCKQELQKALESPKMRKRRKRAY